MDLIISSRSHQVELLPLEVGNTSGPMDGTKYRKDHSELKVVMKYCLDALWNKLYFKAKLEEVFALGIQITDVNTYTSYDILKHGRPARFSGESFGIMTHINRPGEEDANNCPKTT